MKDIKDFKLVGARVLVRATKAKDETNSGIILPSSEKDKQTNMGVVVAVGPGAILENGELVPMQVSVGDVVVFPSFVGNPISVKDDDNTYLVIIERDIMCVVDNDSE